MSDFTKSDIVDKYGISPKKIAVACNGCREIFHPLPAAKKEEVRQRYADGQAYFFYIGAVHPRKNVHRLIAAFDQFKQITGSSARLLIAGRFAWKAGEVKAAFEAAHFQPDIRFLGYVSDEIVAQLMGGAFACVYPSLFEGFGVPVLEALYCDVPVITSNVSSLPEVAGEAGLLVDPTSVEDIAAAMQQIWQDVHLNKKLVAKGREQRTRFNWQKAADVVYENLQSASLF